MKLRDVVMLLSKTRLNLTNEDLSRGIRSRNPGDTCSLAAGNVTRGLARARAAIDHFFVVEEDELEPITESVSELPIVDETPTANASALGCRFCGCRESAGGICLGCGSDS